jgi:hypothetical protein
MTNPTKTEADAARRLHRKGALGHLREAKLLRLEAESASGERRATLLRKARLSLREATLVQESDKAKLAFLKEHPGARCVLGLAGEKATARTAS